MQYLSLVNAEKLSELFGMLANKHRIQVLSVLGERQMNVGEIREHIDITPTALSNHLAKLKRCGVIDFRRQHRHLYYYVVDRNILALLSNVANDADTDFQPAVA